MKFLDDLLEINSLLLTIFGVGIFGAIKALTKTITNQQNKKLLEKELTNQTLELLKSANIAMLHSKIYAQCGDYLAVGYVSVDDFDDLSYLFRAYKALGGNGTGETLYNKVAALPNAKENKK